MALWRSPLGLLGSGPLRASCLQRRRKETGEKKRERRKKEKRKKKEKEKSREILRRPTTKGLSDILCILPYAIYNNRPTQLGNEAPSKPNTK